MWSLLKKRCSLIFKKMKKRFSNSRHWKKNFPDEKNSFSQKLMLRRLQLQKNFFFIFLPSKLKWFFPKEFRSFPQLSTLKSRKLFFSFLFEFFPKKETLSFKLWYRFLKENWKRKIQLWIAKKSSGSKDLKFCGFCKRKKSFLCLSLKLRDLLEESEMMEILRFKKILHRIKFLKRTFHFRKSPPKNSFSQHKFSKISLKLKKFWIFSSDVWGLLETKAAKEE